MGKRRSDNPDWCLEGAGSLSVQVKEMWEGKDNLEALSKVSDSEKP